MNRLYVFTFRYMQFEVDDEETNEDVSNECDCEAGDEGGDDEYWEEDSEESECETEDQRGDEEYDEDDSEEDECVPGDGGKNDEVEDEEGLFEDQYNYEQSKKTAQILTRTY